ncbi:secretin N-terminal domain-containing protein [Candidatus Uabimicrobium amorphum]|uniref:Type II secretion system protein GspD n=1 Tax=Uabimicrobium amorphum TaxID=2596890 RepID=A0A5S9ITH6_UABAM|nr:secretin N-terminal domain-containing protein [Candidatus Uabimicrobium amorphum]BBM87809.1 type II secretion system protein GspD [Candidatus Uabimicrobium amorphum]
MKLIIFFFVILSFVVSQQDTYTVKFEDESLESFINTVGEITGNNIIIYDRTLKNKKINLASTKPITKETLYNIFLSVMEYNGYIVQSVGDGASKVIKIRPATSGSSVPTITIFSEEELRKYQNQDMFITMVINLEHISAREVQTTLRSLRIVNPQSGNLGGIDSSNTIFVTDFAPNVKRIYDVVKLMDQPGIDKQLRVVKLKYGNAQELVTQLNELAAQDKKTRRGIGPNLEDAKLAADVRLNAVIIQAYPSKIEQLTTIIKSLDSNIFNEPAKFHYVQIKNIDASTLQETLSKLVKKQNIQEGEIPVAIETDTQNNALIVQADENTWSQIAALIEVADVRKPQVQIEAALVEVNPNDVLGLGVELFYAENSEDGKTTIGGGSNFGFTNLVAVNGNTAVPINQNQAITAEKFGKLPIVPARDPFQRSGTFFANYDDLFTLPILLNAIQTQTDTRVVFLPSIVVNENATAQLKVADFQPSLETKIDDSGAFIDSFGDFQEAGTTLIVTPHISSENNYLRLDISQTVEAFDRASLAAGGVQAKTTRQLVSSVSIPDGHTVAVGGLTFDQDVLTVEKIPLLGDLPLIGFLFQTRVVTHQRQNVFLFVTAKILKDENFEDYKKLSHEVKLETSSFGVDMDLIDKSFRRYQQKYGLSKEEPEPLYMLEYQSPNKN